MADLTTKIVVGVVALALIVFVALYAYEANQIGDFFSPVRTSGKVKDTRVREGYEDSHLVTAAQVAAIRRQMPGTAALRILGGHSQQIPVMTRIKHHWVRTGTCYDYPIAGTGHLYDGFTVADEAELCLSRRPVAVVSITRIPWRTVGKRDYSLPTSVPTMEGP